MRGTSEGQISASMSLSQLYEAAQAPGEEGYFAACELVSQIGQRLAERRKCCGTYRPAGWRDLLALILNRLGGRFVTSDTLLEGENRRLISELERLRQMAEHLALTKRWPAQEAAAAAAEVTLHRSNRDHVTSVTLGAGTRSRSGLLSCIGHMPAIAVADVRADGASAVHSIFSKH